MNSPFEVPEALDCPHLNGLIQQLSQRCKDIGDFPVAHGLGEIWEGGVGSRMGWAGELMTSKVIMHIVELLRRPRYDHALANAIVNQRFPPTCTNVRDAKEQNEIISEDAILNSLLEFEGVILKAARLNRLDGSSLEATHQAVISMQKQSQVLRQGINSDVAACLKSLRNSSLALWSIHQSVEELCYSCEPIAKEFVSTFSDYILAVVESLNLKLQSVGMEMHVVVYNSPDMVESMAKVRDTCRDLVADLDQTIELAQTNLLLFHQLGPAVARLAMQYQHYLSQIALIKEDMQQFR